MIIDIKKMKFKKIGKNDPLYLSAGLASNSHWIFKVDWISAMKSRMTMGLRRAIQRKQVAIVTAKMQGAELREVDLQKLINAIDFSQYREFDLQKCKPVMGFKAKEVTESVVAFDLGNKKTAPRLDIEYFAAIHFDQNIQVKINGALDPVALFKSGELVGLIMPIRKNDND